MSVLLAFELRNDCLLVKIKNNIPLRSLSQVVPASWDAFKAMGIAASKDKKPIFAILQGGGELGKNPTIQLCLEELIIVILPSSKAMQLSKYLHHRH